MSTHPKYRTKGDLPMFIPSLSPELLAERRAECVRLGFGSAMSVDAALFTLSTPSTIDQIAAALNTLEAADLLAQEVAMAHEHGVAHESERGSGSLALVSVVGSVLVLLLVVLPLIGQLRSSATTLGAL